MIKPVNSVGYLCVIQINMVTKDIPPKSLAVGNPCKVIRTLYPVVWLLKRQSCKRKMHRILRLLTAFVLSGKYDAGILAAPKPPKAACFIVLL